MSSNQSMPPLDFNGKAEEKGQEEDAIFAAKAYAMYREYFDLAERKRRWSIREDIPWALCSRSLDPVIADVIETFCSVEMFLPDYLSKQLPQVRTQRGKAWFLASWGYEESKHSLALEDWLVRSGARSDKQMADMAQRLSEKQWQLKYDNPLASVCYTTMQELATWLNYRNLREVVKQSGGDPALDRILNFLMVDERSHYQFFKQLLLLHLEYHRASTLEQIRLVCNTFRMPAYHLLLDSKRQVEQVRNLKVFDEEIFFFQVFDPFLAALGLTKADLKDRNSRRDISKTR